MANYTISKKTRKNGIVYCARVRSKESGIVTFSKSKTFNSKVAATRWAREIIHKVEKNLFAESFELIDCTLKKLITTYIDKKQKSEKPLGRTALHSLTQTKKSSFAQLLVSKITSADVVNFCLERRNSKTSPSAQTISVDISCIRKVLKVAKSMFNINANDQCIVNAYPALHDLKLIARSAKRERRLKEGELKDLLTALKLKESHHCCIIPYQDIFVISLLTCCRIGEVCKLQWRDLNTKDRTIIVRDRKSPDGSLGNHSLLPLLSESQEILLRQPKTSDRIFPFNSRSITAGFRQARKKLGIEDLRYHDLRREGASRLIELGLSVEETARITGHKDLNVLWQVYVSINPNHFDLFNKTNEKIFSL